MEQYFSCVGKRTRHQTDLYWEGLYLQFKGKNDDGVKKRRKKNVVEETTTTPTRKQSKKAVEETTRANVSSRNQGKKKKTRGGSVPKSEALEFEFLGIKENGVIIEDVGVSSLFGEGPSRVNLSSEPKFAFGDNDDDDDVIEIEEESDENVNNEVAAADDDDFDANGLKTRVVQSKSVFEIKRFLEKGKKVAESGFGKSGGLKTRGPWGSASDDEFEVLEVERDVLDGLGNKGPKLKNSGFGKSGLKTRVQLEPELDEEESDWLHHFDFKKKEVEKFDLDDYGKKGQKKVKSSGFGKSGLKTRVQVEPECDEESDWLHFGKREVVEKDDLDDFGLKDQKVKKSGFGKSGLKTRVQVEPECDDEESDWLHFGKREVEKNDLDDFGLKDQKVKKSGFGKSGLKTRVQVEPECDEESDWLHFEKRGVEKNDLDDFGGKSNHAVSFSGSGNLLSSSSGTDNDDDDSEDEDFVVGMSESSESFVKSSSYEEEEGDEVDCSDRFVPEKDEAVGGEGKESSVQQSKSRSKKKLGTASSNRGNPEEEDEVVGWEGKETTIIQSKNSSEKRLGTASSSNGGSPGKGSCKVQMKLGTAASGNGESPGIETTSSSNGGLPRKGSCKVQTKLGTTSGNEGNLGRGSCKNPKKSLVFEDDHNNGPNDTGSGVEGEIKRVAPKSRSTEMGNQIQREESSKKGKKLNVPSCDDIKDSDGNGAKDETNEAYLRGFEAGVAFGAMKVGGVKEQKSGKFDFRKRYCRTQKKVCKKSEYDHNNGDNGSVVGDNDRNCAEKGEIKRTRPTEMGNQRNKSSMKPKRLNVPCGGGDDENDANGAKISDDNAAKGESNGEIDNDYDDGVTFGEEKLSLKERKTGELDVRKQTRDLNSSNACELLLNAIFAKGEGIEKNFVTFEQKAREQETSPAAEQTLPLKFYFGVEEPKPVEKSEYDLHLDSMWAELELANQVEDIGSFSPPVVETEQTSGLGTEDLCSEGNHQFFLDEEIGIKCLRCSLIKVEIRYNMPTVIAKLPSGISRKKSPSGEEDINICDELQFPNSGGKTGGSCSYTGGTVWDIIPGIKKTMYQHQQEGFEFMWKNIEGTLNIDELKMSNSNGVGGCIISHAPGTGKTRLTIVFLQTYLELFPNTLPVIIAPASMLLTWEEEFRKWGFSNDFHNLNNLDATGNENVADVKISDMNGKGGRTKDLLRLTKIYRWSKGKSILGISYSLYEKLVGEKPKLDKQNKKGMKITKEIEELRRVLLEFPGLLVLDEGHTPRNHRSQIWKALTKVETKRRIILSGTPFQNNFGELYNILCLVRPEFADQIPSSLKKFCQKKSMRRKKVVGEKFAPTDRLADEDEAIEKLKGMIAPFVHVHKGSILRESLPGLKDCVIVLNPASDLQKKIVDNIQCSVNTFEFEHQLALSTVHPSLMLQVAHSKKEESVIDKALLERLRLDPNEGSKTRFLMELIRLSVAMNEKVLVFSQFIDPLHLIKDQLCSIFNWKEGKEVLQMQGRLYQEHRQSMINIFNDPGSQARILLASTKACSEGINLVGASRVVLLDVVWNPSVERQAISRAYRLGQTKVVYTYHLIMLGTSEWEKYCKQAEKDRLSELVFSSNDKENEKKKTSLELSEDKILDELISHEKLRGMFERIIYQPKESKLIETFT